MLANPRTFRCPNCSEMINDSMTQCRYCSVPVDPGVAELIADRQEKANHAYSDASFLRTAAFAMYVFLGAKLAAIVTSSLLLRIPHHFLCRDRVVDSLADKVCQAGY